MRASLKASFRGLKAKSVEKKDPEVDRDLGSMFYTVSLLVLSVTTVVTALVVFASLTVITVLTAYSAVSSLPSALESVLPDFSGMMETEISQSEIHNLPQVNSPTMKEFIPGDAILQETINSNYENQSDKDILVVEHASKKSSDDSEGIKSTEK